MHLALGNASRSVACPDADLPNPDVRPSADMSAVPSVLLAALAASPCARPTARSAAAPDVRERRDRVYAAKQFSNTVS